MEPEVDIQEVVDQYGSYYIDGGQGIKDLYRRLYAPAETASYFQLMPTKDTVLRGASVEMDEVLQPYQDTFTPKGDSKFVPQDIPLFHQKIDWEKNPTLFLTSWLGFLAGPDVDRTQWPFIKYLIESLILPRYNEDRELKADFKGVFAAPAAGVAGAAQDTMNGIKFIRNQFIDDGLTDPIPSGAIAADPEDFCTQIEDWVELINDLYHDEIDFIFMSRALATRYKKGKRKKYNMNYAQEPDLTAIADHENIHVKGLRSMAQSEVIWATPKWNRLRPQKRVGTASAFKVEGSKRTVSIYTDWMESLGFPYAPLLFTNELETN